MRVKKGDITTAFTIYGYFSRNQHPVYFEDLANNFGEDISTKEDVRKLSDSLTILEELGLIKELGVDAYSLA